MSSIQEIKGMPDEEKPFIKTCEIINSVLSSEKLLQHFKHNAIKIIAKEYNGLKKKPIMSTMGGAGTMRTELQMLWTENKGKFQEELLNLIENNNELTPIHLVSKDKWPLFYEIRKNHSISIENATEIGVHLNQELEEIEKAGDESGMFETMKEMMKQNANILLEIKSVKTEVMSNCAKKEDMSKLATLDQVEIKIQESEDRSKTEILELIENQQQNCSREETEKLISDAVDAKIASLNIGSPRTLTEEEIFAAASRDLIDMKRYRAEVLRNKKEGRLQLVLKNTPGVQTFRKRETQEVRCGYEIDFGTVEGLLGAKFEVIPQNKRTMSAGGNLIIQIIIISPYKRMLQRVHQLIRDNYDCKNTFLSLRTPEAYDVTKLLGRWRAAGIITDFENKSFGFLQILVNDGDQSKKETKEYKRTCSIYYVQNPESLFYLIPVTREKLRELADNEHFVTKHGIYKRPEEIQPAYDNKFVLRVSQFPLMPLQ